MMTMIRNAVRRGQERSRQRREMGELDKMDDRALRDIGLTRSDVFAARQQMRMRYWL